MCIQDKERINEGRDTWAAQDMLYEVLKSQWQSVSSRQ